jgi:Flp pilus assembly protein TadG
MRNEKGSVLVFVALIMVILMFMVGMGVDAGWLVYVRSIGQTAVDAGALSGASALPTEDLSQVYSRVGASNVVNTYPGIGINPLGADNTILVKYDHAQGNFSKAANIAEANGVRVSLEESNPYASNPDTAMPVPLFMTPVMRVIGINTPTTTKVNVTATAILKGQPDLPVALKNCSVGPRLLFQQSNPNENSCWTTYTINPSSKPNIIDLVDNAKTCQGIPPVSEGTPIDLDNGQKKPVLTEIDKVYGPFDGSQCFLVPVVSDTAKCTESDEPITAFAKICIKDIVDKGGDKYLDTNIVSCNVSLLGTPSMCAVAVLVRDKPSGM